MPLWKCQRTAFVFFLHVWARAYICCWYSCVHNSILAYASMFLRFCVRGNRLMYVGFCLRVLPLTRVRETPGRSLALPIFTPFSPISLPYAILTHLFVIFVSKYHCIILFIFTCASKHHIPWISFESWIYRPFLLFCSQQPLMLVGEAPIRWWNGLTYSPRKQRLYPGGGL